MKVFIKTTIVIFIYMAFSNIVESQIKAPIYFVGYIDKKPVFNASNDKKLLLLNDSDNNFSVLQAYNKNYQVISVQNNFIVFQEKTSNGFNIVISKNDKEYKYPLKLGLTYATVNDEKVYFTDCNSSYRIKVIDENNIKDLGINGLVSGFYNQCLYFDRDIDAPNETGPTADVYQFNVNTKGKPKKILPHISGECTYVVPSGNYIFEAILSDGLYRPVIYNVKTMKFNFIEKDKIYNTTPYYSYKSGKLVFYNPDKIPLQYIEVPLK